MNCQDFQSVSCEYEEGTLSAVARAAVEQHLAGCEACRRAVEKEQKLRQALSQQLRQSSEALTLRADIRRNILAAAQNKSAPLTAAESLADLWRWLRLAAVPASLLVIAGLLLAIHFSSRRTHEAVAISRVPPIVDRFPPPPVSIQITYSQPAYKFHTDGNVVVDSISYETVVADGTFRSEGQEKLPENPEMKMPL